MIILTALIIFLLASETEAANILSVHIEKDEWSWVGDTAATFKGSIICQGVTDEDPVILRLTLITGPDDSDSGEIVFTSVNHKRLAVRKQKNEYTMTASQTATTLFTGSWMIPEGKQFNTVTIGIEATDKENNILANDTFTMTDSTASTFSDVPRLPDPGRYIHPIMIAAGIIWILALIRIIYHRNRR